MSLSRRNLIAAASATYLLAPLDRWHNRLHVGARRGAPAGGRGLPVRLLLNSGFAGPQAYFFLAQQRGYLRDAGVDVEFVAGDGAAAVVPRMAQEGFDACYGDLNALIALAALRRAEAPLAVYVAFNTTPLTIGVAANGPVHTPRDLEGRVVGGHPMDAALEVFPAYAAAAGIEARRVSVMRSPTSMSNLAQDAMAGRTAGVFGFVHTIVAALAGSGIDGRRALRFLEYREFLPELYGNALIVSQQFIRAHPAEVAAMVRAVNRGLRDTVNNQAAAIEALVAIAPTVRRDVDGPRLAGTIAVEMAHPEGKTFGVGNVDPARLVRAIERIAGNGRLPRVPTADEIFTDRFLPPVAERLTTLAR